MKINCSRGTAGQMEAAFRDKLAELGGSDIEESQDITGQESEMIDQDYIFDLRDRLEDKLDSEVSDVQLRYVDGELELGCTTYTGSFETFDIPVEDITHDIEVDADYIVNSVLHFLDQLPE